METDVQYLSFDKNRLQIRRESLAMRRACQAVGWGRGGGGGGIGGGGGNAGSGGGGRGGCRTKGVKERRKGGRRREGKTNGVGRGRWMANVVDREREEEEG